MVWELGKYYCTVCYVGGTLLWILLLYGHYTLNVYSVLFTVVPVYIAEIAPKKLRGRLMSFNSIGLTTGLLVHTITFFFCMQPNLN